MAYTCICNAIKDARFKEALDAGCTSVKQVFNYCDGRPQCGKCIPFMQIVIESRKSIAGYTRGQSD